MDDSREDGLHGCYNDELTPSASTPTTPNSEFVRETDGTPGFLRIPLEIRHEIYRLLTRPGTRYKPFSDLDVTSADHGFDPTILCVNSQIYTEAKSILYGENTWQVNINYDFNYFHLESGLDNLRRSPHLVYFRIFHLRFCLQGGILTAYPSFGLKSYCEAIQGMGMRVCQVLSGAPGLRLVEVSWTDSTWESGWEVKRGVLDVLKVLPDEVLFRVGRVSSSNSELEGTSCFEEYLKKVTRPERSVDCKTELVDVGTSLFKDSRQVDLIAASS
ncbi:hypothetical protein MMC09_001297 [Bachmanniomyces sp. S44760]|nr:hypothetical protein [Bachmanniomyces sp. S44760]